MQENLSFERAREIVMSECEDIKRLKSLLRSNSPWKDDFDKDTVFMDDQFEIILNPAGNFDIEPVRYKYKTDFIKHRSYTISIVECDPQNFDDVLNTIPVDLAVENEQKSLGSYTFSAGEMNRIIRDFDNNALALALHEVLFNSGEKILDENILTDLSIKLINKIR